MNEMTCRSWWRGGERIDWVELSAKGSSDKGGIRPEALQLGLHFPEEAWSREISGVLEWQQWSSGIRNTWVLCRQTPVRPAWSGGVWLIQPEAALGLLGPLLPFRVTLRRRVDLEAQPDAGPWAQAQTLQQRDPSAAFCSLVRLEIIFWNPARYC